MKCCEEIVTTAHCPHCGKATTFNPHPLRLLHHLKTHEKQALFYYEGWKERYKEEKDKLTNPGRIERAVETRRRTYEKWKAWRIFVEQAINNIPDA
jgi:hypothetical protein